MSRLVVVSNRVAQPRLRRARSEGGLAVAMRSVLNDRGGVWFGWTGKVVDSGPHELHTVEQGKVTYATLDLSRRDYEEYYTGLTNRTLWPLFHYRLDLNQFRRRQMAGYLRVNIQFARRLKPLLKEDDLLWIHDYHLIPMGESLRRFGCRQRIGFFLHIPFPALPVFLALPVHRELVRALCAYDLVGFQTENDLAAFLDYIRHEAGGEVEPDGIIRAFGRTLRAAAYPIGVDTENISRLAEKAGASRRRRRLTESLGGRDLIIGVDRLDYSKGLPQRMLAFEGMLERYPETRKRVTFLQIAPPSRSDVPEYKEIRAELETMSGHVNGTYSEFDWTPIRYLNTGFSRRTLAGFFRASRVGFITPLRDGMNLVAKEFVAAQDPEDPGVLVLSRFSGAAQELKSGAVLVNPYDPDGMSVTLRRALDIDLDERRARWEKMYAHLARHDIDHWCGDFISALAGEPEVGS